MKQLFSISKLGLAAATAAALIAGGLGARLTQAAPGPHPTKVTCSIAGKGPADRPLVVGDTFSCDVAMADGKPAMFVEVLNGTGPKVGSVDLTQTIPFQGKTGYLCGGLISPVDCTLFTISGQATAPGALKLHLNYVDISSGNTMGFNDIGDGGEAPLSGFGAGGPFIFAAGSPGNIPTFIATGCSDSSNAKDIAFSAIAGKISSGNQVTPGGSLSFIDPRHRILCGVALQDTTGGPFFGLDDDPNTVIGGTITYTLDSKIAVIEESGANSYSVSCGNTAAPAAGTLNGLQSCQGAVANADGTVSVGPGTTLHIGLRPGATFYSAGGAGGLNMRLSASFQRFSSLSAIPGVTGPDTIGN